MRVKAIVVMWCLARFAPAQAPACQPVGGDQVLAKDVAVTLPVFLSIPPDTVLGSSPQPGSKRIFRALELASFARRYSLPLENPSDICFEWPMQPLTSAAVLDAMRAALNMPDAQVDLAETSSYPVPQGRIEFAPERLVAPGPDQRAPVLWRGDVVYGQNRRYEIWARVRISAPCTQVMAAEPLRAGRPVESSQLQLDTRTCFPSPGGKISSRLDQVVGRIPLRPIAARDPVRRDWLVEPNEVNRGDNVDIEVHSGRARLAFTGKAESAGRIGDLIAVRNPGSKKIFQARVSGKGKAIVQTGLAKVE